eukprot:TRINITY_DN42023_c0_g1_i1.p1 TRINITY_DN42023_c0_g1~~TRINITY_DN42023_c0_g1_i1.p1  ORF type:complete len:675 (-),score=161.81 TRINITY_DN42023_c0_g1_i1:193-2175(-)
MSRPGAAKAKAAPIVHESAEYKRALRAREYDSEERKEALAARLAARSAGEQVDDGGVGQVWSSAAAKGGGKAPPSGKGAKAVKGKGGKADKDFYSSKGKGGKKGGKGGKGDKGDKGDKGWKGGKGGKPALEPVWEYNNRHDDWGHDRQDWGNDRRDDWHDNYERNGWDQKDEWRPAWEDDRDWHRNGREEEDWFGENGSRSDDWDNPSWQGGWDNGGWDDDAGRQDWSDWQGAWDNNSSSHNDVREPAGKEEKEQLSPEELLRRLNEKDAEAHGGGEDNDDLYFDDPWARSRGVGPSSSATSSSAPAKPKIKAAPSPSEKPQASAAVSSPLQADPVFQEDAWAGKSLLNGHKTVNGYAMPAGRHESEFYHPELRHVHQEASWQQVAAPASAAAAAPKRPQDLPRQCLLWMAMNIDDAKLDSWLSSEAERRRSDPNNYHVIDLTGNRITDDGLKKLVDVVIEEEMYIKVLRIARNPLKTCAALVRLIEHETLGLAAGGLQFIHLHAGSITQTVLWTLMKVISDIRKTPPGEAALDKSSVVKPTILIELDGKLEDHPLYKVFIAAEKRGCIMALCPTGLAYEEDVEVGRPSSVRIEAKTRQLLTEHPDAAFAVFPIRDAPRPPGGDHLPAPDVADKPNNWREKMTAAAAGPTAERKTLKGFQ